MDTYSLPEPLDSRHRVLQVIEVITATKYSVGNIVKLISTGIIVVKWSLLAGVSAAADANRDLWLLALPTRFVPPGR